MSDGTRRRNRSTLLGGLQRSGRIVRPAQHHHPGVGGGVGERIQVVVAVLVQRHRHRDQPGHLREDRIPVECRRRHHKSIPGAGHRVQHLQRDARRARAEHDLLVADSDPPGDQAAQRRRQKLRVPVRRVDRLDQCRAHTPAAVGTGFR